MQVPGLDDSDAALVAAIRAGDDRAFALMYKRYRSRIGAFVRGMLSDRHRAEDVAQEVFIAALRRLRATTGPIALKPWLYEIAKNACIDEHRRRLRAREVPLDGSPELEPWLHGPSPDATVESKQRLADLSGAFRSLSENHHRILVLRELEGLSYSQIGDRLGLSKPVVESTLFRARRRLGEEFAELESGRRCARVEELITGTQLGRLATIGIRERRLVHRHLVHCAGCRRRAREAGATELLPAPAASVVAVSPAGSQRRWLRVAEPADTVSAA
jgi:RNA polymerase sigma factor (sigma-70 family)